MNDRVSKISRVHAEGTYSAPTLTVYGAATKLTASGTGTPAENSTGGGGCSGQTDRNRC